jgi:hypothetical protein
LRLLKAPGQETGNEVEEEIGAVEGASSLLPSPIDHDKQTVIFAKLGKNTVIFAKLGNDGTWRCCHGLSW